MFFNLFFFLNRSKFDQNGEKIPLLTEVIELCLENGQRMFIDIKTNNREMVKVIVETFKKYPKLYEKAVVTTFYPHFIYMVQYIILSINLLLS